MDLFTPLVREDPGSPRLTVYVDSSDPRRYSRMELSAVTVDNWVSKIGNYLHDDLLIEPGDIFAMAMPARWQTVAVALGAFRAGIEVVDITAHAAAQAAVAAAEERFDENTLDALAGVCAFIESFEAAEVKDDPGLAPYRRYTDYLLQADAEGAELYLVADDPWGRGVIDAGHELPLSAADLVAESRVYPDQFYGPAVPADTVLLSDVWGKLTAADLMNATLPPELAGKRVLIPGWQSLREFFQLAVPLWQSGGALVVHVNDSGMSDSELTTRRESLAATENAILL